MRKTKAFATLALTAGVGFGTLFGFAGCSTNQQTSTEGAIPPTNQSQVDENSQNIQDILKDIEELKNQLNLSQNEIENLKNQLNDAKENYNTLAQNYSKIVAELGSISETISKIKTAVEINTEQPVLVDKYIIGKELEIDAVCDGKDVFIPGIMELVEKTGIHSGDSISVYPTFSVSQKAKETIIDYAVKLGLGIGIIGLYNIQFIVDKEENVYVIEVNPRSSRSVPFISKSTGYSLADIGTLVMLGKSLKEQGLTEVYPKEKEKWYVKAPVF